MRKKGHFSTEVVLLDLNPHFYEVNQAGGLKKALEEFQKYFLCAIYISWKNHLEQRNHPYSIFDM